LQSYEKEHIVNFLDSEGLTPVKLINTHCHVDHIAGNTFIANKYGIGLEVHKDSVPFLQTAVNSASVFGMDIGQIVEPEKFIDEGDIIKFGNSELHILYTPGHANGSICIYDKNQKFIIVGDVLFQGGIGRTDLPTGDYNTLINNIQNMLFTLEDDYIVYSGHGPATTIGEEKSDNPFFI